MIVTPAMVNVQKQECVSMKKRLGPKSKRKRKPKIDKKNLNIAALEAGMRRYGGPGCSCCQRRFADIIENPKRYRKRSFRKESGYISR